MSFFSADVVSLYTNIDIQASVKSLIEFSIEHWEELDTWGISATDIHRMLDVVLGNSFFVYANKLYKQLVGLFMGSKPSPLAAIIRVYMFERSSIYRDLRLTFYRRYVDDTASFARSEVEARELVAGIAHEDSDSPFGPLSPCKEHVDDVRMFGYHHVPRTAALACTCKHAVRVANQVSDH